MSKELSLGGMMLVSHQGNVDIYVKGDSTILPTIRLERADIEEIIDFLKQAQRDA